MTTKIETTKGLETLDMFMANEFREEIKKYRKLALDRMNQIDYDIVNNGRNEELIKESESLNAQYFALGDLLWEVRTRMIEIKKL